MSMEIQLERVEDWSTVQPGDPVRMTKGPTQINTVVEAISGLDVLGVSALPIPLFKSEGWVLERPVSVVEALRQQILGDVLAVFAHTDTDPASDNDMQLIQNAVVQAITKAGE